MKKTVMVDMDEVIVNNRFGEFITSFLGTVDFEKLNSSFRQDLIKGREEEFKKIYCYKNLYKNDDDTYVLPLENCVEVLKELNDYYDIYVVTSYVWKENVIDASTNLKNKFDYLKHFLPFLDPNHFIFIQDKTKINFDIGIDDRPKNLANTTKKLLFTEFRNANITQKDLDENGFIRVNNWLEVKEYLMQNLDK